ncbi:MAG: type II CAAX endopeptidase family protein [Anaerococcus sp.]|jgi:abortive infection protein|uniref:CPBP family intramembrane glutamic endopeptidase n=1 Tax=Anaerococcus TaxID=165779 RepID=UPI001AE29835|nr:MULTISPECIES: type II CAAX endopeptidase family protein [Anaerococcus]MBP2070068.1 membrane protease YdiL (CAAX protease family) [Anaerococcus nagyae]MDU2353738.1 type II CAAX endopeptidase family protein [Anaerococcus sp.]
MDKIKKFLKIIATLLAILLVTYLVSAVMSLAVIDPDNPNAGLYILLITQLLIAISTYIIIKIKKKQYGASYIRNKGFLSDSWKMIIIGFGAAGFGNMIIGLLMSLLEDNILVNHSIDIVNAAFDANDILSTIIQTILVVIIAPITEEVLFRGFVFNETNKIFSLKQAIIINGVLFGLYHMNLLQGINTFFLAMVLSIVYYYRRNIYDCIIVHASNNLIAISSVIIPQYLNVIGVILIVCFFIGAYFIYRLVTNNKDNESLY